MFDITQHPIDLNAVFRETGTPEDGAVVLFLGVVRRHSKGEEVLWLDYEAYPSMAIATFEQIAGEACERWGVKRLSIVHRVGRLLIGDVAVAVAAASPHRPEAFEACRYAIDRVKEISPIWKKELTEEGCHWGASLEMSHV